MYKGPEQASGSIVKLKIKETFEFWRRMWQRYKDNTTVAFFELFNEPTGAYQSDIVLQFQLNSIFNKHTSNPDT
jgi:aryl-phospho-beta-D-glucosidase BglC (GH1 family)